MSWGERSCMNYGNCEVYDYGVLDCTVDCPGYTWDGETKQDTATRNAIGMSVHNKGLFGKSKRKKERRRVKAIVKELYHGNN